MDPADSGSTRHRLLHHTNGATAAVLPAQRRHVKPAVMMSLGFRYDYQNRGTRSECSGQNSMKRVISWENVIPLIIKYITNPYTIRLGLQLLFSSLINMLVFSQWMGHNLVYKVLRTVKTLGATPHCWVLEIARFLCPSVQKSNIFHLYDIYSKIYMIYFVKYDKKKQQILKFEKLRPVSDIFLGKWLKQYMCYENVILMLL